MSYPQTELDKLSLKLSEDAKAYAAQVEDMASDPYFREALVKVSVSGFVWALHDAFKSDRLSLEALASELKAQAEVVDRAVNPSLSVGATA